MIQTVFFESTSGPDPGSDLHIVRAVFGTPFWPKSSRNDRFYKGLAPKRGWNLGPAGRPPAGQPGPAKKSFLDSRLIQNTFFDSKHFFRSTLFLIQIRAARKQSKKLIPKKCLARNRVLNANTFFTFSAPKKVKVYFRTPCTSPP